MALVRNLNRPLRAIYVLVGVILVSYAVWGREIMAGIAVAALIVLGALFIAAGLYGH